MIIVVISTFILVEMAAPQSMILVHSIINY
jgi:hypothetical protein